MLVVATRYYDEDLLTGLGSLDDICWLFAYGGIDQFLEVMDYAYRDLILEFLSTLFMEVTSGPGCQDGYILFYLNREFVSLI